MKRQRGRNRNNNNRNNHNNHNRALDSNGPEVKVRGTASTIYEKYTTLARDAQSSGNRVKAENLRQHAEHYLRVLNIQEAAKRAAQEEREAARAARGEIEDTPETEDNKPRKQQSRRHNRDKPDTQKSDESAQTESSSETALDVITPTSNDELVAEGGEIKPKRRRKAPTRKSEDQDNQTVDAAE